MCSVLRFPRRPRRRYRSAQRHGIGKQESERRPAVGPRLSAGHFIVFRPPRSPCDKRAGMITRVDVCTAPLRPVLSNFPCLPCVLPSRPALPTHTSPQRAARQAAAWRMLFMFANGTCPAWETSALQPRYLECSVAWRRLPSRMFYAALMQNTLKNSLHNALRRRTALWHVLLCDGPALELTRNEARWFSSP